VGQLGCLASAAGGRVWCWQAEPHAGETAEGLGVAARWSNHTITCSSREGGVGRQLLLRQVAGAGDEPAGCDAQFLELQQLTSPPPSYAYRRRATVSRPSWQAQQETLGHLFTCGGGSSNGVGLLVLMALRCLTDLYVVVDNSQSGGAGLTRPLRLPVCYNSDCHFHLPHGLGLVSRLMVVCAITNLGSTCPQQRHHAHSIAFGQMPPSLGGRGPVPQRVDHHRLLLRPEALPRCITACSSLASSLQQRQEVVSEHLYLLAREARHCLQRTGHTVVIPSAHVRRLP